MALEKYIIPGETILYRFGISTRFIITRVLEMLVLFGVVGYFVQGNDILLYALGGLFAVSLFWTLLPYFSIYYFITEDKIYALRGFFFRKLSAAKREEITDFKVVQGFLERLTYGTGTLLINTSGSNRIELKLSRISSPFDTKIDIYSAWKMAETQAENA